MTAPFDTEAFWREQERADEHDTWDCADCGAACVGDPRQHWCEETP